MLELPNIPYKMAKNKSQVVSMRGINYSNVFSDGDMADSKNISARAYPYITTREAREEIDDLSGATSVTVFMGDFVYVKGTALYWRDKEWTVLPGAKSFAIINSKLVIMPDKVYLDGESEELRPMGIESRADADFSKNSVKIKINTSYSTWISSRNCYKTGKTLHIPKMRIFATSTGNVWTSVYLSGGSPESYYPFYAYPYFAELVCERTIKCGTESKGKMSRDYFDAPKGYEDVISAAVKVGDKLELDFGFYSASTGSKSFSELTVDSIVGNRYYSAWRNGDSIFSDYSRALWKSVPPDFSSIPDGGCLYIEEIDSDYTLVGRNAELFSNENGDRYYFSKRYFEYSGDYNKINAHNCGNTRDLVGNIFAGDVIRIKQGGNEQDLTVSEVGEEYIEFTEDITMNIDPYAQLDVQKESNIGDIKIGDAITISGSLSNDMTFIVYQIIDNTLYAESDIFSESVGENIAIERRIPDMDFICENNNRIWGCSNKDNTIYASALGDPTNFFDYSGKSTDSYAVAVGSPEAFTGCCRYGGDVLFFKEMKIHKIIGSYPAEYSLYSYDLEGVQKGCSKSLQVIGEILYYKGIHGVFAFNGSPSLISANLGEKKFFGAVSGNDGDTLYMSMTDGVSDYLFAFETKYGMWVLEDDVRAFDFVRIGGNLYMLRDDGKFCRFGAGDSETGIEWHIQFTPFYETISGLKSYSRIVLRLEIPQGSYILVDVKTDGGAWREVGRVVGKRDGIVPVMIPINRCDKFEIKLRGKGKATIHSMVREFFLGGDKA